MVSTHQPPPISGYRSALLNKIPRMELCRTCSSLDFRSLLEGKTMPHHESLSTPTASSKSECGLCSLVIRLGEIDKWNHRSEGKIFCKFDSMEMEYDPHAGMLEWDSSWSGNGTSRGLKRDETFNGHRKAFSNIRDDPYTSDSLSPAHACHDPTN